MTNAIPRRSSVLLAILREERAIDSLSLSDCDRLIREARVARLLPWVAALAQHQGAIARLPSAVAAAFSAAQVVATANRRALSWELGRLAQAFKESPFPVLLLKGAAYGAADLPFGRFRLFNDVDLLVPAASLADAERRLLLHGWLPTHLDAYDQRYYREWMHEVPPLRHLQRQSIVDLHHTIAPPIGRLPVDAEPLFSRSLALPNVTPFRALAPEDQILHSATHLMLDSEFDHALRDLVDIRELLRHYGATTSTSLLERLEARAKELGLQVPWHYTVRALSDLLAFTATTQAHSATPPAILRRVSRASVEYCLRHAYLPNHASLNDWQAAAARRALYVRSHYLKMPLRLLVPHLLHKAFVTAEAEQAAP